MMPELATEEGQVLAWDAFLPETRRSHVERFRQHDWPRLQRALHRDYQWALLPGIEPCWAGAGEAVFWKPKLDRQGSVTGWVQTSPKMVNTASSFANYLKKGFRLRPPLEGVEAEVFQSVESALPPKPPADNIAPLFTCNRHGLDTYGFAKWPSYLRHCDRFREIVELDPPKEIMAELELFPYVCVAHGLGFRNRDLAQQHMKEELRKPGRTVHLSVNQMVNGSIKGALAPATVDSQPLNVAVPHRLHEYRGSGVGATCRIPGCTETRKVAKKRRR